MEQDRTSRSLREWGIRGAAAVAALALGYVGTAHSAAQVLRNTRPQVAWGLAPFDGQIVGTAAQALFFKEPAQGAHRQSHIVGIKALERDPTAISGLVALGLGAQVAGDTARAHSFFAYSQWLSRRNLPTQLWFIESAVTRGSVAEAIRHYDVALRTSKSAPALLYPVLASALAQQDVRAAVANTLAKRPVWGREFVTFVASSDNDVQATRDLLLYLRRTGFAIPATADASVINRLMTRNPQDAWRYYAALHPGNSMSVSRDPRFTADLVTPTVFDWLVYNDAGVTGAIQPATHGGMFTFSVLPGTGGTLLTQTQLVPPGTYRLEGHSSGIQQPDGSLPYWALSCPDGREAGRISMSNSNVNGGKFSGTFTITAGCPVQRLSLVARPSDSINGVNGQIDYVRLVPAKQNLSLIYGKQ